MIPTKSLVSYVAPLALTCLALHPPRLNAQVRYVVHDLGTLGGPVNEVYDLSPANIAVGRVLNPALEAKAVVWAGGSVLNLNGPWPAPGEARGISSNGWVAGFIGDVAMLWRSGSATRLPSLSGHIASRAYDVNSSGTVIGWSVNYVGDPTAVKWEAGHLIPLDVNHSWAFAVNDRGQIVGRRDISTGRQARLWHNGDAITLPDPGGSFASATGISPRGTVITGGACLPLSPTECGLYSVIWVGAQHTFVQLQTFPGALIQNVWSGNDRGTLVGNMDFDLDGLDTRGVVWQLPNLAPIDLNTLIDPGSGWRVANAQAINQRGWIAGSGTNIGLPGRRAILLEPVDPGDLTRDGSADGDDAAALFRARGNCSGDGPCPADLSGDDWIEREAPPHP